ncbi:GMP synthase [glutamine-hydrolyzing] [Endomicrobiia bacterium]|uniref:glutamine-hydrolyzing GMP synthase n=1 Tax=Endomicrobium trichonymphae TaxID=1408204 RepID=UPI000866800F|nr:glutamine-hydrolyzing GMP synthase [Candidatus Endomicrobium trichonymphae]GHT03779.1 GMP synthase [glutamine-hydrolyzing] [Endomicrobiia bacterium]BAV59048.1 GMP synthase [Candidatus Endomicrobium trichonymphae]GHT11268.1 GMP synthase [glutamine-hydrolyzing] [Endomicrobiia bacterium]GHT19573.1 GMP synthase [glutamine-hydrolyzing] [Endomicrobiia bacterium]GHT22593.1 GMP synthase [glutamine-hydrolyzing] [Endomicrobiia bacterium]
MILILDFGSQYTQLIARRIREEKVYCELCPGNKPIKSFSGIKDLKGIILSGGYESVYSKDAPWPDPEIWELDVPILGICYGMQLIAELHGGKVAPSKRREFGLANVNVKCNSSLFNGLSSEETLWMSHGDKLSKIPKGFEITAKSDNSPYAAIENTAKNIYGVQFHPEVKHSVNGRTILKNFIFKICGLKRDWTMKSYIVEEVKRIHKQVGKSKVLCALSGGVDSSVAAVMLYKAIGKQLICVYVDHGLQKLGETERVRKVFGRMFGKNLIIVSAKKIFLSKLKGITDPEQKRKIIGHTFIEVFDGEVKKLKGINFLLQGTIYPDVIESVSIKGAKSPIKSHHNVGGLPEKMKMKLVEPLRFLFKDEVRVLGKELGVPSEIIDRQPFPGPGLAIRTLGEITKEKLNILKEADNIVTEEIIKAGLYEKIWQSFAIILPVKTVGVMGDARTYEYVIAIRAVNSEDAMTADWVKLPYELLSKISSRIINEVKGTNRVVYDISNKPPATIEWE